MGGREELLLASREVALFTEDAATIHFGWHGGVRSFQHRGRELCPLIAMHQPEYGFLL